MFTLEPFCTLGRKNLTYRFSLDLGTLILTVDKTSKPPFAMFDTCCERVARCHLRHFATPTTDDAPHASVEAFVESAVFQECLVRARKIS